MMAYRGVGIILCFGVLNIEAAIQITILLACSKGMFIIRPVEYPRNQDPKLISGGSWKHRCCDYTSWMTVIQYDSSMSPRVLKPVLPDGRQISSGAYGELKVNSIHRGLGDHAQYLFQLDLKNSSYNSHIFKVNFTIVCVWTKPNYLFNLTKLLFSIYPVEQVVEINLYDINRTTKLAHQSKKQGATIVNKDIHHPLIPEFAKRLKIISGALMLLTTIEDNATEMIAEANLYNSDEKPERAQSEPKMEIRLEKRIRIFVNAANESPSSVFPSRTSTYSNASSCAARLTAKPTQPRDASVACPQSFWLLTACAMAIFICI